MGVTLISPPRPGLHTRDPLDDEFVMVVDLSNAEHRREIGRWWLHRTGEGDEAPSPPRVSIHSDARKHTAIVPTDRPERADVGWIDGGWVILDISDIVYPRLVAHQSWQSLDVAFAHTVLPLSSRNLAIQTEEAVENNCKDWPKRDWIWDISDERRPVALGVPSPADIDALCRQGGCLGADNIYQNQPGPNAAKLTQTVVGSFFNGRVRIYSIRDPHAPWEIGPLIEAPAAGNATHRIQINDMYVDEHSLTYANERLSGGLDIIRHTGSVPLE